MRLGIVGAGAIARAYATALETGSSARLVAVADIDRGAARAMAEAAGARRSRSHLELADSGLLRRGDRHRRRRPRTRRSRSTWRRGGCRSSARSRSASISTARIRMTRAATENGVLLSMASKFRFVDDVDPGAGDDRLRARSATPLAAREHLHQRGGHELRWNADPTVSGGGVLIDNGTHSVDIVRYLLGPITEVLAVAGPRIQPIPVEDGVTLMARTAGRRAGDDRDLVEPPQGPRRLHRRLRRPRAPSRSAGRARGSGASATARGRRSATGYDKVAAFARQIEHFVGRPGGEDRPLPDAHDALASVLVIQAAYRSMARGAWTPWTSVRCRPRWRADRARRDEHPDPPHARSSRTASRSATARRSGTTSTSGGRRGSAATASSAARASSPTAWTIGDRVKINAFVYIPTGVTIETGVMVSAGTIFTNDRYPRATTPDLSELRGSGPDEHTARDRRARGRDHRRGQPDRARGGDRRLRHGRDGRAGDEGRGALQPGHRRPGAPRGLRLPLRRTACRGRRHGRRGAWPASTATGPTRSGPAGSPRPRWPRP